MIAGQDARYRGTQGAAISGMFGATVAWRGTSERTLLQNGDRATCSNLAPRASAMPSTDDRR